MSFEIDPEGHVAASIALSRELDEILCPMKYEKFMSMHFKLTCIHPSTNFYISKHSIIIQYEVFIPLCLHIPPVSISSNENCDC